MPNGKRSLVMKELVMQESVMQDAIVKDSVKKFVGSVAMPDAGVLVAIATAGVIFFVKYFQFFVA